jgi:hypothetical protein
MSPHKGTCSAHYPVGQSLTHFLLFLRLSTSSSIPNPAQAKASHTLVLACLNVNVGMPTDDVGCWKVTQPPVPLYN